MSPWLWLGAGALVFVSAALYDLAFGRYVLAAGDRRGHDAAMWSMGTYLVGMIGFQGVLKYSDWFMIPECLGLYLGTRLSLRWRRP